MAGGLVELVRYLVREGLLLTTRRAIAADLALAIHLRRGLRRALERNHDGAVGPVPELAEALRELPVRLDWGDAGAVLAITDAGVRGALARIGMAAHEAASEGIWWRLKICSYDECEWAYCDHSKNRSRAWCEYGCGNLVKTVRVVVEVGLRRCRRDDGRPAWSGPARPDRGPCPPGRRTCRRCARRSGQ